MTGNMNQPVKSQDNRQRQENGQAAISIKNRLEEMRKGGMEGGKMRNGQHTRQINRVTESNTRYPDDGSGYEGTHKAYRLIILQEEDEVFDTDLDCQQDAEFNKHPNEQRQQFETYQIKSRTIPKETICRTETTTTYHHSKTRYPATSL